MRKYIEDLKVGEKIDAIFLLRKKEILRTKQNKPYLNLQVSDKTGAIDAKVWEDAEAINRRIESGSAVTIKGTITSWRDNTQISIEGIEPAPAEKYNTDELIRSIDNIDDIYDKIKGLLLASTNKWLKLLAEAFLDDSQLVERLKRSPGAKSWHNAYIGGLIEHTYETMHIAREVCHLYPEADVDLVTVSAFVHDIGKTLEIEPTTFEYTLEGGLIGHLPLGFEILAKKIGQIPAFPDDLNLHLKHIILSHHGEYDQQSPVLPKTLEATIVYHADELVSQANAVKEIIHTQPQRQREWSNYIGIKNRKYLLKRPTHTNPTESAEK